MVTFCKRVSCAGIIFLLVVGINTAWAASDTDIRQKWAGLVNQDIGCMSLGWFQYGVNLTTHGMVQDRTILEKYGFKFGDGPYRTATTRIDTGRYLISIQSMSRREDNHEKLVQLKTKADTVYPVQHPVAPAGKYTWNSAIQYDMEDQIGVVSHYEKEAEPLAFIDVRIVEPEKLARLGFPGYQKNDTSRQLLYRGNNRWEINPGGGILVYENGRWSAGSTAEASGKTGIQSSKPEEKKPEENLADIAQAALAAFAGKDILVFRSIQVSDSTYNGAPITWTVFQARKNNDAYYLVRHPDIGTGMMDTAGRRMFDVEGSQYLPDGTGMVVNMNRISPVTPSGVDTVTEESKKTIIAWWEKNRLSFTIYDAQQAGVADQPTEPAPATPPTVGAQQSSGDSALLFVNSDFENGDLTNWTATGDAFRFQPTKGDNPTARGRRNMPSKHHGRFWIGTYEKYQGRPGERPGSRQGDRPLGTLVSIPFTITANKISFLIGGGRHPNKENVCLTVDGRTVYSTTGMSNETMVRYVWDVSAYKGKQGKIIINDQHPGGWGHINADDFRYEGN